MRSTGARRKALSRVKSVLPRRRSHNLNTTIDLIQKSTPRKAAALQKSGVGAPNPLHEGVMEVVSATLSAPRKSAKRKSMAEALSHIKRQQQQRAAARYFGCSRKLFKTNKQKAGRKHVSLASIKCVREFYKANSNPLPDKKLVSKQTNKPRHVFTFLSLRFIYSFNIFICHYFCLTVYFIVYYIICYIVLSQLCFIF